MVIIVPAFSISKDGDPPVIGGLVRRGPFPVTPEMRGGIHQPCAVPDENEPKENAPENKGPASPHVEEYAQKNLIQTVSGIQKSVDRIFVQIRRVGPVIFINIQRLIESEEPAHLRPPEPLCRRMGIVGLIGSGMMQSVNCDPFDRAVLIGQTAENGQQIFQRFPQTKRLVRQQSVITETNSQPACNPLDDEKDPKSFPAEGEKSSQSCHVD